MPPKGVFSLSDHAGPPLVMPTHVKSSDSLCSGSGSAGGGSMTPNISVGMAVCESGASGGLGGSGSFGPGGLGADQQQQTERQQHHLNAPPPHLRNAPSPLHQRSHPEMVVKEIVHAICPNITIMLKRHITAEVAIAAEQSNISGGGGAGGRQIVHDKNDYFYVHKVLQTDRDRAKREAQHHASRVRHPHILKYLFCERHKNGAVEVEMELAELGTLDYVFLRLPTTEERIVAAKACARQILSGLVYYYEVHGRCHRDVKGANFLMSRSGCVKIADFDVSRTLSQKDVDQCDLTIRGTAGYMSPELIENALMIDPLKCDAWSLGVVIFQGVEGRIVAQSGQPKAELPFDRFRLDQHQGPTEAHIKSLAWGVLDGDEALGYLVRRCLMRDPAARASLLEALAITYVVKPGRMTTTVTTGAAEAAADAAVAAACTSSSSPVLPKSAAAVAASSSKSSNPTSDFVLNEDMVSIWSNCFLDENDECTRKAKELGVQLADSVLRGHVCTADDPLVGEKVAEAARALQREFQTWKQARVAGAVEGREDDRAKLVDRVMRDVVVARNQRCIAFMAELAARHKLPSLLEGLVDEQGRPRVPMKM